MGQEYYDDPQRPYRAPQQQRAPYEQDAYSDQYYYEPAPRRRMSGWLIALIVVVILLILCCLCLCAAILLGVPLFGGPVIGNTFSTIIEDIMTATPMP